MKLIDSLIKVRQASRELALLEEKTIQQILCEIADSAVASIDELLAANQLDLARMDPNNPKYDRLQLTPERIRGIATDMKKVAELESPVGQVLSQTTRPNGMEIKQLSVPFGVIGIIYEARPNVSFDVFGITFKTRNACVLKGGSDAEATNIAILQLIHHILQQHHLPKEIVTLLPNDHEVTRELLHAVGYVDLIIPRGSSRLINFVRENAKVPVIETGAGICHTYVDKAADINKAAAIVTNAKTRRVSVCNAMDALLIHADRVADLPTICQPLAAHQVIIYADVAAYQVLEGHYPNELLQPALPEHFGTEFLAYKMAIKTVNSLEEALLHIQTYSSQHSECIVTEDKPTATRFTQCVDAACVYTNVSTAFTDGAQFGLGAEIGISTQKLHARGPMGLAAMTTYKWVITGDGLTRNG